jgi:Zn-finger nucleic acid-binding protein
MKLPFKHKDAHSCDAVVLACIDFRFWKETMKFVEEELGIKSYDFPKLPGSAKAINECQNEIDVPMKCVGVPCDLHHVEKIVIVNHADCGAYGGSKEFKGDLDAEQKFHEGELKKAKEKILKYYPDKEVVLVYAKLVDKGENIEFMKVG